MDDDSATDGVRAPTHSYGRQYHHRRRIIKEALDLISSLPDVILQHILSFIPTKFAIRTSLLSKRWRHVWCDTPSISFDNFDLEAPFINEILTSYTAPKIIHFHLGTCLFGNVPHINRWIKFVMSRNVENLFLDLWDDHDDVKYEIPDFFYINSSVKQLTVELSLSGTMIPTCCVSWTSLKKLYLRWCSLSDESIGKILSGCPILESLKLYICDALKVLDLSKSMSLRTLEVVRNIHVSGPTQIVAPYIHCLILRSSQSSPCTLVDVSSLVEAKLDMCVIPFKLNSKADFLQDMVLKMLEKLQNVEKLTFGEIFLQMLTLAELRGVPFPMFKVKDLTLKTSISRNVIHGIERILQNSPDLKTLTVHTRNGYTIPERYLYKYVASLGLNLDQFWRSKDGSCWNRYRLDVESKHVVSFMKLMLKTTKTLEKMVVQLEDPYHKFKELVSKTLSHNNNVSIVLLTMPMRRYMTLDEW